MADINQITERIIGCALTVHQSLGPGLLESVYEAALTIELELAGLLIERQKSLDVTYRGVIIGQYRIDLLVERNVVVELKSVEKHNPVYEAQLLSYMRMGGFPLGLLLNFNTKLLKQGIRRYRL
ncbi:MAG: GxxExxY protein [Gammaproteobacteria bacterium]|nr:GxxExxY protein [Gammaproteobacteria bacterium]